MAELQHGAETLNKSINNNERDASQKSSDSSISVNEDRTRENGKRKKVSNKEEIQRKGETIRLASAVVAGLMNRE